MKLRSHSTRSAASAERRPGERTQAGWSYAIAVTGIAALFVLGVCAVANAQTPPARLVSMGERLAKENCGGCHAMEANETSALADAPPLRELRARYTRDAMAQVIAERMEVIHSRMPLLRLDVDEVPEFLKYWDSLEPAADHSPSRH